MRIHFQPDRAGRVRHLPLQALHRRVPPLARIDAHIGEHADGVIARHLHRLPLGGEPVPEPATQRQRVRGGKAGLRLLEHRAHERLGSHVARVERLGDVAIGRGEQAVQPVAHLPELLAVARRDVGGIEVERVDDGIDHEHIGGQAGEVVEGGGHGASVRGVRAGRQRRASGRA